MAFLKDFRNWHGVIGGLLSGLVVLLGAVAAGAVRFDRVEQHLIRIDEALAYGRDDRVALRAELMRHEKENEAVWTQINISFLSLSNMIERSYSGMTNTISMQHVLDTEERRMENEKLVRLRADIQRLEQAIGLFGLKAPSDEPPTAKRIQ